MKRFYENILGNYGIPFIYYACLTGWTFSELTLWGGILWFIIATCFTLYDTWGANLPLEILLSQIAIPLLWLVPLGILGRFTAPRCYYATMYWEGWMKHWQWSHDPANAEIIAERQRINSKLSQTTNT